MRAFTTPPTEDDILAMAEAGLAAIPARLAEQVRGVAILVEPLADDELLADMGIETPWELTGLYRGVPISQRSVSETAAFPDTILLFREAILLEWIENGEDLGRLVASVLVHEIAHHFGFSDAEIEAIEAEMG
jgi:predicted Zn-dependent protease with MMP-like domain